MRAGRLVDVVAGRVLTDQLIGFVDGRIVSVVPYDPAAATGPVSGAHRTGARAPGPSRPRTP